MIIKVTLGDAIAFIDNTGKSLGEVSIYGDPSLTKQLNFMINEDTVIQFGQQAEDVLEQLLVRVDGILHKDTSNSLYFHLVFPHIAKAFGYELELLQDD